MSVTELLYIRKMSRNYKIYDFIAVYKNREVN